MAMSVRDEVLERLEALSRELRKEITALKLRCTQLTTRVKALEEA
jgi:hypothetical protein